MSSRTFDVGAYLKGSGEAVKDLDEAGKAFVKKNPEALDRVDEVAVGAETTLFTFKHAQAALKSASDKWESTGSTASKREYDEAKVEARTALADAKKGQESFKEEILSIASKTRTNPKDVIKGLTAFHEDKVSEKYMNAIKMAQTLDLCFVIDATGSMAMQAVFECLSQNIRSILKHMTDLNPNMKFQLSFVAYRDPEDGDKHIECCPFTSSRSDFEERISSIKAEGGDDQCEDVIGGLQKATELNWQCYNKLLFLCGDAPCHGKDYHALPNDSCYDKHPSGIRGGVRSADVMRCLVEKKIQVVFWKVNDTTNKMIKKLNDEAAATGLPFPEDRSPDAFIETTNLDVSTKDTIIKAVSDAIIKSSINSITRSCTKADDVKGRRKISNTITKALKSISEGSEGSSVDGTVRSDDGASF